MEKSSASQNLRTLKGLIGNVECRHPVLRGNLYTCSFYVCAMDGQTVCQTHSWKGAEVFFHAVWGCETTGNVCWKPQRHLIRVARN